MVGRGRWEREDGIKLAEWRSRATVVGGKNSNRFGPDERLGLGLREVRGCEVVMSTGYELE